MLEFDAQTHTYRYGGVVVPSVTAIINKVVRPTAGVPESALEHARARGVLAHRMCELYDIGADLDETFDDPHYMDAWPYLDAWSQFLKDSGAKVMSAEARCYSKLYGYAGTTDRTVIIGDDFGVLDIKCTATLAGTVGPQLAAYAHAYFCGMGDEMPLISWSLRLCPRKAGAPYELRVHKNHENLSVFLSMLNIYNWMEKNGY